MPATTRRMTKLRHAANDHPTHQPVDDGTTKPTPTEQVVTLLQELLRDVEATMIKQFEDLAELSKLTAKLKTMIAQLAAITADSAALIAEMIATPPPA